MRLPITTGEADSSRLVGVGAGSSRSNRERIEHWGSAAFADCFNAVLYVKLKHKASKNSNSKKTLHYKFSFCVANPGSNVSGSSLKLLD